SAQSLHLSHKIGTLAVGIEADLCVLNPKATPLLAQRTQRSQSIADALFALMILGDDRCIEATWVNGHCVYQQPHKGL
ncbi:amidohydrolase family protein, partial [Acetobacter orientalis]|uniref:amidohydrolase family protein n=1 Tax=Acetobacter orientalis TaxID=146474 RepID=UPI0039EBA52D